MLSSRLTSLTATAFVLIGNLHAQGLITTYAGANRKFTADGQSATGLFLSKVSTVTLDSAGNPIIALRFRNVVLRVNSTGTLSRLAGTGDSGSTGNGLKATDAPLYAPQSAAYDASGNLYIADTDNHRIQIVSAADGTVSTFAGTGRAGFSGDNGPAKQAQLNSPTGVLVDTSNNVYINDEANQRIRKVSASGIIMTVAGGGNAPFAPVAGGPGLQATQIFLLDPGGIALDPSGANLYVTDFLGQRVFKVDAKTGAITNIAGTGTAGSAQENVPAATAPLRNPGGVAVDSAGNVYISDTSNFKIRKIAGGNMSTYAGNGQLGFSGDGGPAASAMVNATFGLAIDQQSNLFIADRDNFRVRRVDSKTQTITTVAGNGTSYDNNVPANNLLLFQPAGVTLNNGSLYISDSASDIVRGVTPKGIAFTAAGTGAHGFGGDGGPATNAELATPYASAFDAQGNLYIADLDNYVVRMVDPSGKITTVAGSGTAGYNGDTIAATSAQLNTPTSLAVDSAGNLYIADYYNNRVRKVSNGVITSIAANATPPLNHPESLAIDSKGNLLIADSGNGLVRSYSTSTGALTTIAGATTKLGTVLGVAADNLGNIYFSDATNNVVQKVTPAGSLSTVAGNGTAGYAGDGGNPTLAELNSPRQIAVDSSGNLFIADFGNDRIRVVYTAPPTFSVGPNPVGFTAASGGLPVSQTVALSTALAGLPYSASVAPGAPWLSFNVPSRTQGLPVSANSASGQMNDTIAITADPSQLTAGTKTGTIVINSPLAVPSTQNIPVNFIVGAAQPSQLFTAATQLNFFFAKQGAPSTRIVQVANQGGSTLSFSAKPKTDDGGTWLSVSSTTGSATPAQPFQLGVAVDPTTLSPGTYTGSVTLTNNSVAKDIAIIAVNVTVSSISQTLLLSDTGLTFTAIQGGGSAPAQTFEVINNGAGTMNWTLTAATVDPGLGWLSVSPAQGSSTAGQPPPQVTVQVNPAGLNIARAYYGTIKVQSPGAQNSPQVLTVVLNLLPTGQIVGPVIQPTGLIFTGAEGGPNPAAQTVTVTNLTATPLVMGSSRTFVNGANWFVHDQINATIQPNFPLTITVTPLIGGLAHGVYLGALSLSFSDGSNFDVAIRLIVAPAGSTPPSESGADSPRLQTAAACAPTTLIPLFTTLGGGFSLPASWPQQVIVKVADDCGIPLTSGSVTVTFSDGDKIPKLNPVPDGSGRWVQTWNPAHNATSTTVTALAKNDAGTLTGTISIPGGIQKDTGAPLITAEGVISVTNASPGAPLAPGEFITIYGSQLAPVTFTAPALPFETSLQGVQVLLDLNPVPVQYVSSGPNGQINAIIPYGAATNGQHSLAVQNNNQLSPAVQVTLADSLPTVFFSQDQNGNNQGAVLDPITGAIFNSAHPASAGTAVEIFCEGLGVVDANVQDGFAAPGNPLANATGSLSVTIGGQPATILFQGLAPGFVSLYQINAIVPKGVQPGPAVPVNISMGGRASNQVTIAIQ